MVLLWLITAVGFLLVTGSWRKSRLALGMVSGLLIALVELMGYDQYLNPVLPTVIFAAGMAIFVFCIWQGFVLTYQLKQQSAEKHKHEPVEKAKNAEVESPYKDVRRHDELVGGIPDAFWSEDKLKNDEKAKH